MKKFAVATLGCKVNQYESNSMKQMLQEKGYEQVSFLDVADIYIINTCTVTEMAAKKSKQMTRKAKSLNSDSFVIVTGCLAQNSPDEIKKQTGADLVLGNMEKSEIISYISSQEDSVRDIMKMRFYDNMHITKSDERTRAYVKIQDGCVNFCSYCIIPYVRGPVRSRELEDIINEVISLSENDVREVVLTGIHLDSYGADLKESTLTDVIRELNKIEKIDRIRLSSLEPTVITPSFISEVNKYGKLCHQFHLSLQSGCDRTLKEMNRKYTADDFRKAADLIYSNWTDSAITTDIIVGFPGETEQDFLKSLEFVSSIGFLKVHVFKFSRRKGTKAYDMKDQVSAAVKDDRSRKMIELSAMMTHSFMNRFIGQKAEVLTEEHDGKYSKGHTRNYIPVVIENENLQLNEIYEVILTKNKKGYMTGEVY
ncbi:MAG: tRNA (N(6)-L-threonylcarbamoyladenosine(37)-C(2))-methylthiotransferase MtaB [Clostridia bacterium]|nr:tRNA (N(6)-L-threonylcarbamoyladenosine(37)-C(2))-methylthiotransferase MtaB [Clostridia bacterium]